MLSVSEISIQSEMSVANDAFEASFMKIGILLKWTHFVIDASPAVASVTRGR